ncbi:flavohemoglobin expression-modulating QEGLA motif protein [Alteromonas sp. ASW11-130]|uniref:flavohemoglobin expression-modulating QEGLA motif protein n=1 Tax=Alteromonas sp. ASW11-130 TaxID=3015775 RepID=UPI002242A87D|nr:flavohemoglobin expression-modulating QEGLA motif protein [Alteromonas sp. ASW11-130]MCW8092668.1 flavohemoglobin expression-modulating QEGLA motif protein [Alteromonas sp. ASW11-130]
MDKHVFTLDAALYNEVKGINILQAVAPQNYRQEKSAFFDSTYRYTPKFTYSATQVDVFSRKRALYNLPLESLTNPILIQLYQQVIHSYADKLDQFLAVGTPDFLYDSMRYYGEPTAKDIRNAHFILHLPDEADSEEHVYDSNEISNWLSGFADEAGYDYEIVLDNTMIANAMVSDLKVKVNQSARINETELKALAHHELGVHLATTLNARHQPLKIMTLGSPVNTTTQEGLAILCEYLSGNLTLSRLKVLAMRVLAVASLIKDKHFNDTFLLLKEQYHAPDELAFTITARVYRGGGFTKDYLYLQGFRQMLNGYEQRDDFHHLLCGKASYEQLDLISEMIKEGYLHAPKFISPAIKNPAQLSEVDKFIAHAIK